MSEIEKSTKEGYAQSGKNIEIIKVKEYLIDGSNNQIYIFDEYNEFGDLVSFNRYCVKDSSKQPFSKLTNNEELILNPPIENVVEHML